MTTPLLMLALAHAQPLLLDAGPLAGPTQDGFYRLTPEGSEESRASWSAAPRRADVLPGPDPLRTDEISGGTLHLDLAPGTWDLWVVLGTSREDARVWAGSSPILVLADGKEALRLPRNQDWQGWLGSTWFAAAPRPVFRERETGWHRQVLPGRPWRRVRVEVDEDGVDLEFRGLPLHALAAWPSDDALSAEVELTVINAKSAAWFERHRAPAVAPPPITEGPLGAHWIADEGPVSWEPHLALGDRVHRLLQIHGGDAGGTVQIEHPTWLDVQVREATWLDLAGHGQRTQKPRPMLLESYGGWQGGQGVPPVLSVSLRTHDEARPGLATVRIHLTRNGETHTVELPIEVHDTYLLDGPPSGVFLQARQEAVVRQGPVRELLDEALGVLADHHLQAVGLRYLTWPGGAAGDLDLLTHATQRWRDLGGTTVLWSDAKLAWRRSAFRKDTGPVLGNAEQAARLMAAAKDAGVVVHTYEEEAWRGVSALQRAPTLFSTLRRLQPTVPLAATLPTALDLPVAEPADVVLLTGPTVAEHAMEVGDQASVWAYNLAPGRGGPLQAWAAGAETFLQWHADSRSQDPFDHTGVPTRWTHLLLHPDGRFHSTVQLEELAAGVSDVRLLTTLQACATRLSPTDRDLLAWRRTLSTAAATPGSDAAPWSTETLDRLRSAALSRLDKASNTRCAPPTWGEPR